MSNPIDAQLADFSTRLRSLRSGREWTLEELAERSGLSKTFLSRLEAGERQPSIAAVLTLANCFGVPVGSMFESVEPRSACVIVRGTDAASRSSDGLTYASLSSTARFTNLQPMRITVSHRRRGDERFQHEGEEWLYVLSGRLQVAVGDAAHELKPGDTAHFDSRQPHRLTALGNTDVELILVACPMSEKDSNLPRSRKQHRAIR